MKVNLSRELSQYVVLYCLPRSLQKNQPKVTAVAPESGKIQTEQNAWGTITVTDDTRVTREYQGCIHISGTYPYETTEYMGLCVSMESAIETGSGRQECTNCTTKAREVLGSEKQ